MGVRTSLTYAGEIRSNIPGTGLLWQRYTMPKDFVCHPRPRLSLATWSTYENDLNLYASVLLLHNDNYVVFLFQAPYKSQFLYLTAVGIAGFHGIDTCGIYTGVTQNICQSYYIFLN